MPTIITWNLAQKKIHTGSAEVNGVPNTPFAFQHPQDMGGTPVRGAFTSWMYNHGDYTNDDIVSSQLSITVKGMASYSLYKRYYKLAQKLAGGVPDPWQGQDGAPAVFASPLARDIQPSGLAYYEAYISENPALPKDKLVNISASMFCLCRSRTAFFSGIEGSKTVDSSVVVFNHNGEITRIFIYAKVRRPFHLRWKNKSATYAVIIPAGGSVKVGKVQVGLGYHIKSGSNRFFCRSRIRFVVNPAGKSSVSGD